MITVQEICKRRFDLDRERSQFMKETMRSFDKEHYKKKGELQDECGQHTGHNFLFSHLGPLNNPWYYCSYCGKASAESVDAHS